MLGERCTIFTVVHPRAAVTSLYTHTCILPTRISRRISRLLPAVTTVQFSGSISMQRAGSMSALQRDTHWLSREQVVERQPVAREAAAGVALPPGSVWCCSPLCAFARAWGQESGRRRSLAVCKGAKCSEHWAEACCYACCAVPAASAPHEQHESNFRVTYVTFSPSLVWLKQPSQHTTPFT